MRGAETQDSSMRLQLLPRSTIPLRRHWKIQKSRPGDWRRSPLNRLRHAPWSHKLLQAPSIHAQTQTCRVRWRPPLMRRSGTELEHKRPTKGPWSSDSIYCNRTLKRGDKKVRNLGGVGIMLNKKWRQRIIDTEYINERAINATIVVNRQRIKLMSVYFFHSRYADHHIEKCTKRSRSTWQNCKTYILIVGGNLMQNCGTECMSVGRCTLNEGNKRGDWMKHWLMLQGYTGLNTMYRKNTSETDETPSQRHDPHGKRPQMCHGNYHGQHAWKE